MNIQIIGITAFAMAVRDTIARFAWSLSEFDGEYDLISTDDSCIIPLTLVDADDVDVELDTYGCYIQVGVQYFKPWSVYYEYEDRGEQWVYEF